MVRSSFFEFGVASSALFTAQSNYQIAFHNIANSTTPGYSRQYGLQKASQPMATYNGTGMVGTGSTVYGIKQVRNLFLDKKYWEQQPILGEYYAKNNQLDIIEKVFNELADEGLNSDFTDFFTTLQNLSTNPGDLTYRNNSISSAETMVSNIGSLGEKLQKQQTDINEEIRSMTEIINSIGRQIKSLNEQIKKSEIDGSNANDLRDQRALLVDELSRYVNVEAKEIQVNKNYDPNDPLKGPNDTRYIVTIDGKDFVNDKDINTLELKQRDPTEKRNEMDVEGLYDIYFSNSGEKFNVYGKSFSGELKGLFDVRDGNSGVDTTGNSTTNYKGLPHYMNKLNELARTFSMAMNEGKRYRDGSTIDGVTGHVDAYDLNKNNGNLFFSYKDSAGNTQTTGSILDYNQVTFKNIVINPELLSDPSKMATSSSDLSDESDPNIVLGYINLGSDNTIFRQGKVQDFLITFTSELAITKGQATKFEANYTDIVNQVNNQRISVSGVDMNEEIATYMQNVQLYQAAARLTTSINTIYDTLINRMGI